MACYGSALPLHVAQFSHLQLATEEPFRDKGSLQAANVSNGIFRENFFLTAAIYLKCSMSYQPDLS